MPNPKIAYYRLFWIVLASFFITFACSSTPEYILYEGEDFTFSAPATYKTEVYETPVFDQITNSEILLSSSQNVAHYPYFHIIRQQIPSGSNLDTVFADYVSIMNEWYSARTISQNTITMNNRTAIEYVHREFVGEPYVQVREIWMEYNGWAYSLVCASPVSNAPEAVIPVSEQCLQLVEGFQFK